MTPETFGRLTPGEFYQLVDGSRERWRILDEYVMHRASLFIATLVQPHVKKRVKPKKLYDAWMKPAKAPPTAQLTDGEKQQKFSTFLGKVEADRKAGKLRTIKAWT